MCLILLELHANVLINFKINILLKSWKLCTIVAYQLNKAQTRDQSQAFWWYLSGSHYSTLTNLIVIFSSIVDVLDFVIVDDSNSEQKEEARSLLKVLQSSDLALRLHLMRDILGITNELSQAIQRVGLWMQWS